MNNDRNKSKSIARNAFRVGSFVLIWILLILAFYRLGSWQLDRADQVNNPPTTKVSSQPIPIEQVAQPGINIRLSAVNRIVILKGQYVEKYKAPNQTLMTDEKVTRDSAKFTFDVQVMKLDSGNHVLVARKILPANADNLLINGEVIATGRLYPNQNVDRVALTDGVLSRLDPALVVSQKFPFFYDGYVILQQERYVAANQTNENILASELIPSPLISQKVPGFYWQHISYVVVWWFMALLVLIAPLFRQFRPKLI